MRLGGAWITSDWWSTVNVSFVSHDESRLGISFGEMKSALFQKSSNGFSSIILSHHFSMKNQSGVAHTVVAARENVVPGGRSIRLDCWVNGGYLRDEVNQVICVGICKANQLAAHYWLPIFPTKTSLAPTQDTTHCWSFKLQVVLFLWHSLTS